MEGGKKGRGRESIKVKHDVMHCGIWNRNCTNSGIRQLMQDTESWHSCERFVVDAVWEHTWCKGKRHNIVGKRETQNSGWCVSLRISWKNPVWILVGTEGEARADMDYWYACFVAELKEHTQFCWDHIAEQVILALDPILMGIKWSRFQRYCVINSEGGFVPSLRHVNCTSTKEQN